MHIDIKNFHQILIFLIVIYNLPLNADNLENEDLNSLKAVVTGKILQSDPCLTETSRMHKSPADKPAYSLDTHPRDKSPDNLPTENNVVIYIHGTHSKILTTLFNKRMVLPSKLNKFNEISDKCFYKWVVKNLCSETQKYSLESSYIFGWSGSLCNGARMCAAKDLYKELKKLREENSNVKITIIAHSHGGNVVLNLVNFIGKNDQNFEIEKLVLLACPVQEQTKYFAKNRIFKKIYNIFSKFDLIQILDLQKFHTLNKNKDVPFFSERLFEPSENIKQTKLKINDIGLMHIDFVFPKFIKILPQLVSVMDNLDSNDLSNLIKIDLKDSSFKIISKDKKTSIHFTNELKNKENITIFIHGTRRLSKIFYTYNSKINELENFISLKNNFITYNIAKSLNKNKTGNYHLDNFYCFGWSGKLDVKERCLAAEKLYLSIKELINKHEGNNIKPKITLITHSHGGNVALNLANCIESNCDLKIENLILLACPVQEHTKHLVESNLFKNVYNLYSKLDMLQILDIQGMHKENENKKVPFFSERTFNPCLNLRQAKIKINNRALTHIEFLSDKFLKNLDFILKKIQEIPYSDKEFIIKV